jgi:hypothetical protein
MEGPVRGCGVCVCGGQAKTHGVRALSVFKTSDGGLSPVLASLFCDRNAVIHGLIRNLDLADTYPPGARRRLD